MEASEVWREALKAHNSAPYGTPYDEGAEKAAAAVIERAKAEWMAQAKAERTAEIVAWLRASGDDEDAILAQQIEDHYNGN